MFNNLSRDFSLKIHYILDQLVPPILRDSRMLMAFPLWLVFRHRTGCYLDFKEQAYAMTDEQFREFYRLVSDTAIKRESDLNKASVDEIMKHATGGSFLDAGCGHGFLANLLSTRGEVTAVDIIIPPELRRQYPHVTFHEANVESLPFPDQSFDTVVCTHTLEHVRDVQQAIAELRRVGKRLIVIVPRQRPYKYSFDLHLNFFPYLHSLLLVMRKTQRQHICKDVHGDIFYMEW